ncbi:MAG TPA: RdgB/HAM1 family non-canonical purine NTP pyrophosphatase [Opitutaceae bacterium]|jgi:XTP/dITP diphosphohydrolase
MKAGLTLVLASGNAHKAEEFRALVSASGLAVTIATAKEFGGMPAVEEDTGTFAGNARKKARALRERLAGNPAWILADDSGLCVEALGGEPGVESAYYAGAVGDAAANRRKLLESLRAVPEGKRQAYFYCLLFLLGPDGAERLHEGRCDGRLIGAERGSGGFGYDSLFVPDGFDRTLAELTSDEKNRISHRGRAWRSLVAAL